ncbi:Sea4p [Sugiyamaella lignohabitans]|uniref:Sea4p n=1 Tax=Sugiyamaella lignohabitans TaxID=796027 RepID=A0A161HKJ9_9ASCO|nr:Sea4p [Sugiyamaella lignohabitans]ANB12258.1 Sea4p [Sugiyamaella lignohabitans]
MKIGVASSEPALLMNRLFGDTSSSRKSNSTSCYRFSNDRQDEFTILHDGNMLRRWQIGVVPGTTVDGIKSGPGPHSGFNLGNNSGYPGNAGAGSTSDTRQHSYISRNDTLFVASVLDSKTEYDKVTGFDYASDFGVRHRVSFMCMRQSGQVFRMTVPESPDALRFDPYNDLVVTEPERMTILDKSPSHQFASVGLNTATTMTTDGTSPKTRTRRFSSKLSGGTLDEEDESDDDNYVTNEGLLPYNFVLDGDISTVMRRRALNGYSNDCEANIEMLNSFDSTERNDYLKYTWKWLSLARRSEKKSAMALGSIDLAFEGVSSIWEGWHGLLGQKRYDGEISEKEFTNTITKLLSDKKRIFTSPSISGGSKEAHRQLCLRVAGWNFELSQLNDKIKELEDQGKYEQAAGWAVFHGDVERAVTSLASSRKERLRLMSTAVAGYLAYKDSDVNSPWREQCRKLASELDNSYLRAIFAYIADGSWLDVLDEGSLPLNERLGIALRFLPEGELTAYLNRLADRAVHHGDLEGILLTGLTPRVVDLLQSYVDKTSDVQTAALIASFGCPRFFTDQRVENWIQEYHRLLNGWQLFKVRAKFDVARTHLSRDSHGEISAAPVPRQIYLRCSNCKKTIKPRAKTSGSNRNSKQLTINTNQGITMGDIGTKCENCNTPLPRCAVCLESLGSFSAGQKILSVPDPISSLAAQFEGWPTFCLSCNHGMHAGHAEEWFSKHDICPVPDCNCLCNAK